MADVQLSDLPVASSAADADLMLIRNGLTDYQIAVSLVRSINIPGFSNLPSNYAVDSDYLMINRGSVNYKITYGQVGFAKGTKMWFYNTTPPTNWSLIENTGDRLLAVSDSTSKYKGLTPGQSGGTWQQEGVGGGTPGGGLSVAQLPPHQHRVPVGKETAGSSINPGLATRGKKFDADVTLTSYDGSENGLLGSPHNHGNLWRPLANIGLLANKDQ